MHWSTATLIPRLLNRYEFEGRGERKRFLTFECRVMDEIGRNLDRSSRALPELVLSLCASSNST